MNIRNAIKKNWTRLQEHSSAGLLFRLFWFLVIYFIAGELFTNFNTIFINYSIVDVIHQFLLGIIYKVTVEFYSLFYGGLSTTQDYIVIINNVNVIQLYPGCSGYNALFRITIILLLYPLSWKTKSWIFPISWLIILFAAIIHFILLIPIAYHWHEYFSFCHKWFTRIIFYGFFFLTWLIWEKVGYPKKR